MWTGEVTFAHRKWNKMKILMVCLGNICRSPLAEGILQKKIKENGLDWEVDSAGTESYHVGEAPHHFSQKVARINGIDLSCQKARRFTAAYLKKFNKNKSMAAEVYN
jgi:protein-tyrosine phosphatase